MTHPGGRRTAASSTTPPTVTASTASWAQRLQDGSKQPVGAPFAVQHFHGGQRGLAGVSVQLLDLAVAPGRLVLNLAEQRGNVWAAERR